MLKFSKQKERIKLRGRKGEGLSGKKILIKGNNDGKVKRVKADSGKKKKKSKGFKYLKLGKSTFPDETGFDDEIAKMAREVEDDMSISGMSSEGGNMADGVSIPSAPDMSEEEDRKMPLMLPKMHDPEVGQSAYSSIPRIKPSPSKNRVPPPSDHGNQYDDESGDELDDSDDDDLMSVGGGSVGGSSIYSMEKGLEKLRNTHGPSPPFSMSQEELDEAEKQDLLMRLHQLRGKGVQLSKNYTARSSLNELRMEMGRIEHERETQHNINKLRRYLMIFVGGLQTAINSRFAPRMVRGKLNGYSTYVLGSIEDYDPVFERMSEKYGGVVGLGGSGNPLLDLFLLMSSQMFMFFMMNHYSKKAAPTEEDIKQFHPDLIRRAARDMADEMRAEDLRKARQQMENQARQFQQQYTYENNGFSTALNERLRQDQEMMQNRSPSTHMPVNSAPMRGPSFQYNNIYEITRPVDRPSEEAMQEQHSMLPQGMTEEETNMIAHAQSDDFDLNDDSMAKKTEEIDLPDYEPVVHDTLPRPPPVTTKSVNINTRRGKNVKVNETPQPQEDSGKRVVTIT